MTNRLFASTALLLASLAALPAAGGELARPTPEQVAWHDMELEMFIHFAPSTWQDTQHDNLSTPLSAINPEQLDTEQWADVAVAMGAKQIVFVAKHVGGFCWWQTDTTDYSVKNTPWRGGQGDVMKDLAESCRKRGLKLGVYLSPADGKHSVGVGGRAKVPAEQENYNRIYRQQLTELLSRYGEISEVWFDGSNTVPVGDILQKYAPHAMIFQGPQATISLDRQRRGLRPLSDLERDARQRKPARAWPPVTTAIPTATPGCPASAMRGSGPIGSGAPRTPRRSSRSSS